MKLIWKSKTKIDHAGIKAIRLLQANGFQAFWVGGVVRNILLKRESTDIDIATDAIPDEIEKILQSAHIKTKPIGKKFGSILALVDGFQIEITTFRAESRYSDRRHPDRVHFIKEYFNDAKRRDFTINAFYFDSIKKELYDPTNGLKDLKGKLLRFVDDPKKRIDEDALRMLRGVRFATQFGFRIEKNSFAAIKTRAKYIQDISGERIKAELDKILLSPNRDAGFELLDKSGLLKFIIPEFEKLKHVFHGSKRYHLEGSVFAHTKLVVQNIKIPELSLIYAAIFHDVGKIMEPVKKLKKEGWVLSYRGHESKSFEIFQNFAKRLRFSKKDSSLIGWLVKNHDNWRDFLDMRFRKQYHIANHDGFDLLIELWRIDLAGTMRDGSDPDLHDQRRIYTQSLGKTLLNKIQRAKLLVKELARGDLIMKYGNLKPGKQLGQKIEGVKIQIVLGKIKNEEDLRVFLK